MSNKPKTRKTKRGPGKSVKVSDSQKVSLKGLSLEDALRGILKVKTGKKK